MQGYCDVYKWTILKRTSPEVKCLHLTSSRPEMCMSSVSNVIYHKISHGAAFYTLNGKNVNVMLEYSANQVALRGAGCFLRFLFAHGHKSFFTRYHSKFIIVVNGRYTDLLYFWLIMRVLRLNEPLLVNMLLYFYVRPRRKQYGID